MKFEYVAPLCAALESGEYKQISRMLHSPEGYCCLGIVCEITQQSGTLITSWVPTAIYLDNDKRNCFSFSHSTTVLPMSVMNQLGMKSTQGKFQFPEGMTHRNSVKKTLSLSELNDSGFTFGQIADCIRYFWKEL